MLDHIQWNEFTNKQQSFTFTRKCEFLMELPFNITPEEILSLFLDEKIINFLVANKYADQKLLQHASTEYARFKRWKSTTSDKIKTFIGLMIWMDLVQTPLTRCWPTDPIYNFPLPCSRMPRINLNYY